MKKSVIGFLLGVLCLAWANAQSVDNYKFASSTGTYTALTDGTALTQIPSDGDVAAFVYNAAEKVAVEEDDNPGQRTIAGIDMGFDFKLGGETYRKFAVTGYGYVLLGKADAAIEFTAWDFFMNRMDGVSTAVGIATDVPVYGMAVRYAVTGETGSKVLTVQFSNISYEAADAADRMHYQIKFHESDGRVEMLFNGYKALENFKGSRFNVGLVAGGKYHFRVPEGDYATTEYNASTTFNRWDLPAFPASLTYTFSLPDPCAVPTYVVTDIKLTPKSNEMGIEVLVDTAGKRADGVLLIVSDKEITESPEGMNFIKGQEALGGTVLAVGSWDDFDLRTLDRTRLAFTHGDSKREPLHPNTTYHYTVYMANTKGCIARYTEPTRHVAATATTAPDELKITGASLSEMTFSAKANGLNEAIAILMTTGQGTDENGNRVYTGNYAEIPADAAVGDKFTTSYTIRGNTITDTTEVLYVGAAGAAITCPVALENNRIYYFGAVSKGKDNGAYSTLTAQAAPHLTPAILPFTDNFKKNLSGAEDNPFIGGWKDTRNFEVSGGQEIDGVVSTMTAGPAEAVLVIPALDFPQDSNVLVNISYSLDPYSYNSNKVAGDSICLEISTDGGKTFKTLKAVHKETDNMTLGKVILSDYLGAKQAVLRLRAVCANTDKAFNIKVSNITVTALPFCPAPGAPRVSAVYGGTLGLTWNAGENGETQWNISTAPAAAEGREPAWSRPNLVEQKPYYLTGLGDSETYNVRVQAVCAGAVSGWVESQVKAGRVPSFTEDFNGLEFEADYYGEMKPQLPANWEIGYHYISPWSGPSTSWYGDAKFYEYKTKEAVTAEAADYNGSLAFDMQHKSGYIELLQTPMVELNPVEKPQFTFDAAFGTWVGDALEVMPEENRADTMKMAVWVCDSGRFNITNAPVKVWNVAELATWNTGKTIEFDLSEYVTVPKIVAVVFGIYTETKSGDETNMLYLDNIGIVNTKPLARSVKVAKLSAEDATIQWVADKNVEKWLVKLEGGSLTAPRFFTDVTGNTQLIDGLEAEKTYTASVTPASNGETAGAALWVSVTFKTPAASCDEPTGLTVSGIEQKSAVLTWRGEAADGYYVRYRSVAAAGAEAMPWIEVRIKAGTAYTMRGLVPATEYECEVQGVCSEVADFYSDWVALEGGFMTKAITCFAPTELRCPEATIGTKTAKVSWTGTSGNYQVAWTLNGTDDWTCGAMVSEAAYTITGLNYNQSYTFKVRGVCAAGDSSEWSEGKNFRTLQRPDCAAPANLRVEALTQTSADLKWDYAEAEEDDLASFTLRHREASVQAWDSIKEVHGTAYAIKDMKPQTAYIWNVMALCRDDRNSEWLNVRFTTLAEKTDDTTAVEDLKRASGLYVAASQGQVHVMNPKAVQIDNIRIYSVVGRRLEHYVIRSNDNVILTTGVRNRVAVVEVESAGRFIRFKIMLP